MNDLSNQYSALGFNPGYYDLLILDRNVSLGPDFAFDFNSIEYTSILNVENLSFSFAQEASTLERFAGEGADPNTFGIGKADFNASFNMLLKVPSTGYVDFGFAHLFDCVTLAYKGTGTSYSSRLITSNNNPVAIGTTYFTIDNIADFKSLTTPFQMILKKEKGSEIAETVTVSSVDKATRRVYLNAGTARTHTPSQTYLWATSTNPGTNREPSFSLVSLFQGLLSNCLVNKMVIDCKPGQDVDISCDLKFTNINRKYQIDMFNNFNTLAAQNSKYKAQRAVSGSEIRINSTSFTSGGFGLTNAIGQPFFGGFQGIGTTSFLVQEINISIDNQLEHVYALHSVSNDEYIRRRENLIPHGIVSNGRKIEGTIKYLSPIAPWTLAEKLAGPSSINNGGIEIDFGTFKISFPEVVWYGSKADSPLQDNQTKEIKFLVTTQKLTNNPVLAFSNSF